MIPAFLPRRRLFQRGAAYGLLLCGGLSATRAEAQSQTLPPTGLFENLATLELRPGAKRPFLAALRANATAARASAGNIGFNIFEKIGSPDTLFVLEQWQDAAAYRAHLQQPALLAMHAAAKSALQGPILRQFLRPASAGTGPVWARPDDPGKTADVLVELKVKPGLRDALLERLAPLVPIFRAAPGNVSFDLYKVMDDPDGLVQIERWVDKAAHVANLKRPVIARTRAAFGETLARPLAQSRADLRDVTEA